MVYDKVMWVNYFGLKMSKNYVVVKKYLSGGFGGLLGFGVKGGFDVGKKVIELLKLFSYLVNIGDVKLFVIYLVSMMYL